jgi:hypothetical protein
MKSVIAAIAVCVALLVQTSVYSGEPGKEGENKDQEKKPSWFDNVQIKGDFRYRHETAKEEDVTDRNRERIRVRLGADAKVDESIKLVFRIASCADNDPRSTNQTLDDGFTHKAVWIDLAYFEAHPKMIKGLSLYGGKMNNPFLTISCNDLIWDFDLTPEGLAFKYSLSLGSLEPFVSGCGFVADERAAENDAWLVGGQTGLSLKCGELVSLKFGIGYFDYQATKGRPTFYHTTEGFGNSVVTVGPTTYYINDYDEFEGFAELSLKVGSVPLSIFADYVTNRAVKQDDTGYLAGFAIGKTKEPGDWSIKYIFRKLEKDAVIGAFTDADCWGGGTNGEGNKLSFELVIVKNTTLGLIAFFDKKDLDNETDYNKYQVDISFKF